MAVARAELGAVGTMVICTGNKLVSVAVGPDGAPAKERHACTGCVWCHGAVLADVAQRPEAPTGRIDAVPVTGSRIADRMDRRSGNARAPPLI